MGKYGDAAVNAVQIYANERAGSMTEAWDIAVAEIFPDSPSSQVKGCPRGTFLVYARVGSLPAYQLGNTQSQRKTRHMA